MQFNKWYKSVIELDKNILFKYVKHLKAFDKSYSYIKNR